MRIVGDGARRRRVRERLQVAQIQSRERRGSAGAVRSGQRTRAEFVSRTFLTASGYSFNEILDDRQGTEQYTITDGSYCYWLATECSRLLTGFEVGRARRNSRRDYLRAHVEWK